jgi:hypothetical protein
LACWNFFFALLNIFIKMESHSTKMGPACPEAQEWHEQFESSKEDWYACERGDWLMCIASGIIDDVRLITLVKGHQANTVRHLMKDQRSIKAIDTAIAFGEGKATIEELNAAYAAADAAHAAAADDAAYAHAAAAAAAAAYAHAAAAADDAAYAHAAAAAAYAAAYAADTAYAADAAYDENQRKTADIARKYLTKIVLEKIP